MRLNFNRIEIHNFMSFADEVFDFNSAKGMNLITGKNFDVPDSKNGAGKSTVFSALLWSLYGQLPSKIKSEHIANRFLNDKEVRVVTYLDVDGVKYKAVSGLNKRAAGYFQLFKEDDNGEEVDLTKSSIAETRDFFENEILHCDISLFLRTILLTSVQDYNFFNLKKQDKKEFIEKLFDISVFGDMYDKIHKDVLQEDKKVVAAQNQLLVINNNIDDYSDRVKQFDMKKESDVKLLQEKITAAQGKLIEMQKTVVQKNTQLISKFTDALVKLQDAKQKASTTFNTKKLEAQHLKQDIDKCVADCSQKANLLAKHAKLLDKLCADCKKVFLKYHNMESYQQEIDEAEAQVGKKKADLQTRKDELLKIQDQAKQIQEKIDKANLKLSELNEEYDKSVKAQDEMSRSIDSLKFNLKSTSEKTNPFIQLLESSNSQKDTQQKALDLVVKNLKYLRKAEQIVSQDSLKKFIIKDLIGLINNRIKTYLMKMGAKFTCMFDENLDYDFMTDSGQCELQNFSCGEKKRIEIATCLSFRDFIAQRSNISSNILILDEYIDSGIDTLAVDSILKILKDFTVNNNQNIFIISHRSEVNCTLFDNVIELQKKNGISKVQFLERGTI